MIRPIDMQMLLPRTESVGNAQQHENQSVVNSNLNAASAAEKEVKQNSETVVKKEETEFAEYKYDAREEGNGTYKRPAKKRAEKKGSGQRGHLEGDADTEQIYNDKQPRINIQI